ncbi:MAG: VOC family protein [Burkholderiales bacterium]
MPPPGLALDHLVVGARTLEEGTRWLEARVGAATVAGGRHARMGTHNRLLSLGEGTYLEIIAIDPQAPPPGRPRWFALDSPAMADRLASGPVLIHWVARTGDLDAARDAAPDLVGEALDLERGDYRWRIGVRADGELPAGGAFPSLIQWLGERHPAAALPAAGCRLERLSVRTPDAAGLEARLRALGLAESAPVEFVQGEAAGISAELRSPRGLVLLPESVRRE